MGDRGRLYLEDEITISTSMSLSADGTDRLQLKLEDDR